MTTTIEKVYLNPSELRKVCVENNYYTRGNTEDYQNLFNILRLNTNDDNSIGNNSLSNALILKLATNIYNYSTIKDNIDYSKNELIASIMYSIKRECRSSYEIIDN